MFIYLFIDEHIDIFITVFEISSLAQTLGIYNIYRHQSNIDCIQNKVPPYIKSALISSFSQCEGTFFVVVVVVFGFTFEVCVWLRMFFFYFSFCGY